MATSGGDAVALDLVYQRGARDAQYDRGPGAITGVVLEGALDVLALEVFEAERRVAPVADAGPGPELTGQVLHAHRRRAAAQNERPLEHVPHLPHVAGPAVGQQAVEHLARQGRRAVGQLGPEV